MLVGIRVAGEVLGEILQGSIIETLVQDVRVFRLHFFPFSELNMLLITENHCISFYKRITY